MLWLVEAKKIILGKSNRQVVSVDWKWKKKIKHLVLVKSCMLQVKCEKKSAILEILLKFRRSKEEIVREIVFKFFKIKMNENDMNWKWNVAKKACQMRYISIQRSFNCCIHWVQLWIKLSKAGMRMLNSDNIMLPYFLILHCFKFMRCMLFVCFNLLTKKIH